MAEKIPSKFQSYKLTSQEEEDAKAVMQGGIVVMYLHNERTAFAERKLRLLFNPANPENFMQQEAEISSAIAVLTSLIGD